MKQYQIEIEVEGSLFRFSNIEAPNELEAKLVAWEMIRTRAATRTVSEVKLPGGVRNFFKRHFHWLK